MQSYCELGESSACELQYLMSDEPEGSSPMTDVSSCALWTVLKPASWGLTPYGSTHPHADQ